MMASPASLLSLLTTLTTVLTSTSASLPIASTISPPSDGISLLDTKNELLLSYLHNLVFLIILKIRSHSPHSTDLKYKNERHEREAENEDRKLRDDVTKKLVELRVYLEKGVRPLEGKLRYQIEKLVSAANEADAASKSTSGKELAVNGTQKPRSKQDADGEGNEDGDDDDDDEHADPDTENAPTSINPIISDLSHRPNPSAFTRPSEPTPSHSSTTTTTTAGPYKPPRITPTALPTTTPASQKPSRQRTSHTLNEYIREEIDDAPLAEPSIGAGSGLRGREKAREEERRLYEEMRLVRLPEEKGKGKGKRRGGEVGGDGRADLEGGFGGVEGVDFGGGGRRRRKGEGGSGGGKIGEAWGRRVKRGVGRKGKK